MKNKANKTRDIPKMTYGAPILKSLYKKYIFRGLLIAIFLHIILIGSYFSYTLIQQAKANEIERYSRLIELSDLDIPPSVNEEEQQLEKLEIIQKFIPLKDLEALIPEPVARERSEILTTKTQDALNEIIAPVSSTGDENAPNVEYFGEVKIEEKKIEEKIEKEQIQKKNYQQFEVEKAPVAVNLNYIQSSMKYPDIAISAQIEGRVTAKVLVGIDGSIIKVIKLSGPDVFYSEVKNKIMGLQFTPALQNGISVKCYVSVPFNFKLK